MVLRGWRLLPIIVKTCDDLRQEQCASQMISQMNQILLAGDVDCWLRPYDIIALSPDSGLIEVKTNMMIRNVVEEQVIVTKKEVWPNK
jgi:phosphatidylinositol kinase/protein kinase (PI-3  family)